MSDNKAQEGGGDDGTSQTVRIKEEPNNMKDYAEDTMNELLGWYGYGDVGQEDTRRLHLKQLITTDESPRQVSPPSSLDRNEDEDEEAPSDLRVNTEDEPSPSLDVLQRLTDSGDNIHACAWCQKRGSRMLTLETPSGRRHYCSEQCFTQSRRASFKRNRVCDWCRHVRYTISFVDFQDGENQLQFCSDKCLNQYKMNIFCRETQEHLRTIHSSVRKDLINGKRLTKSKQILITPDLWMKDEEQDTPLNLKTLKNKEASTNRLTNSTVQEARQKVGNVRQTVVANGDHTVSPHSRKETIVNWDSILLSRAKRSTPVSPPSANKSGSRKQPGRIRSLLKSHNLPLTSGFKSPLLSPTASVSSSARPSPVQRRPPSSEPSVGQTPPLFPHLDPPRTPSTPNSGSTTPVFRRTPVTPSLPPPFTLPHPFLFPSLPPLPFLPPHPFAPIVPPTTCLVPYPIVIPFPVPIPIPIPIEKSKWEEMKKKASEQTTSGDPSPSSNTQSSTAHDNIELNHTSGAREDGHTPTTTQCNNRTVSDESGHSSMSDNSTSEVVPKERALLSIPKTDHAYSLRRSLILDAPNVPKKRHRSPSPNERHYRPKKALNLALNNK